MSLQNISMMTWIEQLGVSVGAARWWWHFSYGDQVWARLNKLENPHHDFHAIYGRYDLVEGC